MGQCYYQTNVLYFDKVNSFFESLNLRPQYEFSDGPSASGLGRLVRIALDNFNPEKLDKKKKEEWSSLPLEVFEK